MAGVLVVVPVLVGAGDAAPVGAAAPGGSAGRVTVSGIADPPWAGDLTVGR
jgi:hypothetical protein